MRNILKFGLGIVFAIALIAYMVTFRVEFTERAVKTTFGEANQDSEALGPGLHFKWPYPFQSVTKYDTRIHYVESTAETQQTADNKQIIVESFCFWRVSDPLEFFRRFSNAGDRSIEHFREAEEILKNTLRSGLAETGQYALNDLFPADGGTSRLGELEGAVLRAVRSGVASDTVDESGEVGLASYGIEVVEVGISRILMPQATTQSVIERMRENRTRLVTEIESKGNAEADRIKTTANSIASTIRSFAQRRAREIEAEGDIEAAPFIARLDTHPEFAIFLENLDTMSRITPHKTTWVLPSSLLGLEFIDRSSLIGVAPGQIPFPKFKPPALSSTGETELVSAPDDDADGSSDDSQERDDG